MNASGLKSIVFLFFWKLNQFEFQISSEKKETIYATMIEKLKEKIATRYEYIKYIILNIILIKSDIITFRRAINV